ncbi:kinetochore-associated protein NSL1 homolog isoform X2 [Colius striatus]|uniref:kinetochore-associated protein NSL1 homolog isoform X2 n=1 Tax=Colius striatus TaxID=57412 RepID=UPI002B1DC77F|nr:kinetochore-associated protein NSL1 homolog isoform X2 [Colius striatus]
MPRPGRRGRSREAAGSASGPAFSLRPRREMAAGPASPLLPPPPAGEAEPPLSPSAAARRDPRNFETAVRENVTINGQHWEEASDDSQLHSGSNIKILEDQFDGLIVETATKRKQWPKKILTHAIQTMKAEQEMLKLYQPSVTAEEIRLQPSQDACMADLKQVTEMASKQISGAMKSLPALIERAEGFSQALTWQPTLELCKLRQEVFAGCKAKEESNVQNFVSPGEVTPTDTDTSRNPYILLKRKKAVDSAERRRYPLRRRKIALST